MASNTSQAAAVTLEKFLSLYEDMNPEALAEGLSPDNPNMWFLPRSTQTRPAMERIYSPGQVGNVTVTSLADFPFGTGLHSIMFEDSLGNLYQDSTQQQAVNVTQFQALLGQLIIVISGNISGWLPGNSVVLGGLSVTQFNGIFVIVGVVGQQVTLMAPGAPTTPVTAASGTANLVVLNKIDTLTPGNFFKAENFLNKQWYAFYGRGALQYSQNQFAGVDIPRYYDGITNVWRVTQDTPGAPPNFTTVNINASVLQNTGPGSAKNITAVIAVDQQTITVPAPPRGNRFIDGGDFGSDTTVTYYQALQYTTSVAHGFTVGQNISISGFAGSQIGFNNANAIVLSVPTSTTFTCYYYSQSFINVSGLSGPTATPVAPALTRSGNTVTAYTAANPGYSVGWEVNIGGPNGAPIYQSIGTISTISRDVNGNVTATLTAPVNGLPVGTQLFVQGVSDATNFPATIQTVSQVLNSGTSATITNVALATNVVTITAVNTFSVGENVSFSGLTTATFLNGQSATVTGVTGTTFTAAFTHADYPSAADTGTATGVVYQLVFNWIGTVASSTGGSVSEVWSGTFQIQTVSVPGGGPYTFTYFQLGPNDNASATNIIATPKSQVNPGFRSAVCLFEGQNGAITGCSIPITLVANGGSQYLIAKQIPIGPQGTKRRIIAFTLANGSEFYYLTSNVIPSENGLPPQITLGTTIEDNTTTTALFDFADAQLSGGTDIGPQNAPTNNKFNSVVLAPCAGTATYNQRMFWWGETNNVKRFLNMGFDGGYMAPEGTVSTVGTAATWVDGNQFSSSMQGATIYIANVAYVIQTYNSATSLTLSTSAGGQTSVFRIISPTQPLGWSVSGSGASLVQFPTLSKYFGFALQHAAGSTAVYSQSAFTNFYGNPIAISGTQYQMRFLAAASAALTGTLSFEFFSPTMGSISIATVNLSTVGSTGLNWYQASFTNVIPTSVPSDTVFRHYVTSLSGGSLTYDELEVIDSNNPVLQNQIRVSTAGNPYHYDAQSGLLQLPVNESIVGAFKLRANFSALTQKGLWTTQDNGSTEPAGWNISLVSDNCGCSSPNAVAVGEEVAFWAGQYGGFIFTGDNPKKITQELQRTWDSINWNYQETMWVTNDPVNRILLFGLPLGNATATNTVAMMSYRAMDAMYNVPDPLHVTMMGKLAATDLARKWSLWGTPMNAAAMCSRSGQKQTIMFAGGNGFYPGDSSTQAFGNLYTLDFASYTDDDYGAIDSYFFTSPIIGDAEMEQAYQVGAVRKLAAFLTVFATGVGQIEITPYVDNIENPLQVKPLQPLTQPANAQLYWGLNVRGERFFFKIRPVPNPNGTSENPATDAFISVSRLTAYLRPDTLPVPGAA